MLQIVFLFAGFVYEKREQRENLTTILTLYINERNLNNLHF